MIKDPHFERMVAIACERMDKYEVVLSVLAQGDASPWITDEFRSKLVAAKGRLGRYTVKW